MTPLERVRASLMKTIGRQMITTMNASITGIGISETKFGITFTIVPD